MYVLVTGGAGYVGSVLVPALLANGHRVRVLDQLRFGGQGLLACCTQQNFALLRGDMCDEATLARALEGVEAIVHLAAVVGYPACQREPERAINTNVSGTKLLLGLRKQGQLLLLASTGSVYGSVPGGLCSEKTPIAPITLYARTKGDAEGLVLGAGNAVVYRYATAFGTSPCMRFDLLPNDFVNQAVHRRSLAVYEGGFRRTFIHVDDMARSVVFSLEHWDALVDGLYNVGHESMNVTKAQLAQCIRRYVNYDLHFDDFAGDADQRNYAVSYEKIRAKGFTTTIDLDRGIAELVTAARLMRISGKGT